MTHPLRIVQLNLAYDAGLSTPGLLLERYFTLTGWAAAVHGAGAEVITVQRFARDAEDVRGASRFLFVADPGDGLPGAWDACLRAVDRVVSLSPDVVHVNGLMFPGAVRALRRRLPNRAAIVLQDHSGIVPRAWPWPIDLVVGGRWARAFAEADAFVFTARELAERWRDLGVPSDATILELPPAGSTVVPLPATEAVRATGMRASPAILWTGRLDDNKDPLTVLAGLEMAIPRVPGARCWMIYGDAPLEAAVQQRVSSSPALSEHVTLVGTVPHDRMGAWFSAADIFVSGSHHEGSGYSMIEAMSCGVMPCVTNIPSFRAMTGELGVLWAVGDADACAAALVDLAARDRESERARVRQRYADALSWESIGRRTVSAYRDLAAWRRRRAR